MAKQTTEKKVSQGICHFCQGEFAKNKMIQHLKTCKERVRLMGEQDGPTAQLLHLQIEGNSRPEYWMHLELPGEAMLSDLDDFLRAVWLECCDHLSEFTVHGVSYSSAAEGGMDPFGFSAAEEEEEVEEEDVEAEEAEDEAMPSTEELTTQIAQSLSAELHADLKDVPVEQIEKKLEQLFSENLPMGLSPAMLPSLKPMLNYMASALQEGTLAEALGELEAEEDEADMDVELGEILNVGDKFSYTYDFGSSTKLSLRVLSQREGRMLMPPADMDEDEVLDEGEEAEEDDDDDESQMTIVVMAHNEPPALACHICGKPAVQITSAEEFTPVAEVVLCAKCSSEYDDPDELLPIVNSPRVGVCGYTGPFDEVEEWDDDDEADEDDDEE